jgi:exodeoxyribonuclease III
MKIATWNVNSINMRKSQLITWLKQNKPEVLLLQEIKCEDKNFPKEEVEELGYNLAIHGQKGFNGVAILSLFPIDEFIIKLPGNPLPEQARYIEAVISIPQTAIRVASVYVPNGEDLDSPKFKHKLEFLDALKEHCENLLRLEEKIIIGGDFNIAPEEIDSYNADATQDSILCHLSVRKKFRSLINLGFYNAFRVTNPKDQEFSWWDYRRGAWQRNRGMLIDHILLSPEAVDILKTTEIHDKMRGLEKPSDHVPVVCEFLL